MKRHSLALAAAFFATCALAAEAPPVVPGSVKVTTYDGITDDLLSAGLNLAGLVSAVAPGFVDPSNPTPAELRRRAIYGNYRGIVDPVPAGGMGVLWGPQSPGTPTFAGATFGLIPGVEYKAYLRVSDRQGHVNNAVYLHYVEEAAVEHARQLGFGAERRRELGGAWVVRRHEIEYLRAAVAGDRLRVETRVANMKAANSVRRTEIFRNQELLCRAATDWVYVDLRRGRPLRIPEDLRAAFPIEA